MDQTRFLGEGLAEAMALLAMPGISQIVMVPLAAVGPLAKRGEKRGETPKTMGFHRKIINHQI